MAALSLSEIHELIAGFESGSWPKEKWNHRAHLIVACWYLDHHPEAEAIDRIRSGIQAYNLKQGFQQTPTGGYHETLTLFLIRLLVRAREEQDRTLPFVARLEELLPRFTDFRALAGRHYSKELLNSWEARTAWREPDLLPLP